MKTTLIITEKNRISQAIARALVPDTFNDRGSSSSQHCDIVSYRTFQRKQQIRSLDDLSCEVLKQSLDKGGFYFCQSDCLKCEFEVQHLDKMGSKSAGRVRKRVKYVNENIMKDLKHSLIDVIRNLGNKGRLHNICSIIKENYAEQVELLDYDAETIPGAVENICESLVKENKLRKDGNLYILAEDIKQGSGPIIAEDINYFLFERNKELVIIVDTCGNPYNMINERGDLRGEDYILRSGSWKDLEKRIRLASNVQSHNIKDLNSHKARNFLFNSILIKRLVPCDVNGTKAGSHIDLDRVIAATDFDIAGSSIFMSVIDFANYYAEKQKDIGFNYGCIDEKQLYRMKLQSMDSKDILKEFENPLPFDWENAYAGKARTIFDFLYGTTITGQLWHFKDRYLKLEKDKPQKDRIRFTVGRTLFLGLKKIIEQERKIRMSRPEKEMYLVFDGLQSLDQIRDSLRKKDFSSLVINKKLSDVSYSRFLSLCEKDHIGTHTTRYKLINRLYDKKVIMTADNKIISTPFGNFYYKFLANYLEKDRFSIDEWNKNLNVTMESWNTDETMPSGYVFKNREEMEKEFNRFMEWLLPELKGHLKFLKENYKEIVTKLWEAYDILPKISCSENMDNGNGDAKLPEDRIILVGKDKVLPYDLIEQFIDPDTNMPKNGKFKTITRVVPQKPVPIEDHIRRVCCIDREYEFQLLNAYRLVDILGLGNEKYTVFKVPVLDNDDVLTRFIASDDGVDSYVETELDESNFAKEDEIKGHDPLCLTDVTPSDIVGGDGLLLIQEYNNPWMATLDKIKKKENGLINVASFRSMGLDFDRVERYTFGLVHNFETLLTAMMEKYNMPFWKTAKLAEDLYLNT